MAVATREDVIACYRNILGREPENEAVISFRIGSDLWDLIREFSHSLEHSARLNRHSCYSFRKFERSHYLAQSLSSAIRASALIHNYAELRRLLQAKYLTSLFDTGLLVIEGLADCRALIISAHVCDQVVDEGEITIIATNFGLRLAYISFTIVDGSDFGFNDKSAILISRIHGCVGVGEHIKSVCRDLGDMPIQHLLVSVAEGVALSLGIKRVIGVEAVNHPAFVQDSFDRFVKSYDDLFLTLGAETGPSGFYHYDLPRVDRPLGPNSKHRSRRRARRTLRRAVALQAELQWSKYLRIASPEQSVFEIAPGR
ncbi:DUF535 family protein [Sphingomonas sp. UYEF23]|uniref:DUF535 family protein n=1 Tax=Sphingomonas sp. UYEF23 TaxID=1756408 RepID=UPI0033921F5E